MNEGGRSAWRNFFNAYTKLVPDAKLVGEAWPKLGTQEFTPYLTAIMNSGADLIFTCFYQTDALTMIKQSITIGLNGKIAIAGLWLGTPDVVPKYNADFYPKKTVIGGHHAFWAVDTPECKKFVKKVKSRWGVYPTCAASGYGWVKLMAKTIEKVGSLDTEKVINALEGAVMETPLARVEIRACDHLAMQPYYVGVVEELPGWEFYGSKNPVILGAESYISCEEVNKRRMKK